jgi:hypothetical protein
MQPAAMRMRRHRPRRRCGLRIVPFLLEASR